MARGRAVARDPLSMSNSLRESQGPLPLLVLLRDGASQRALGALRHDPRVEAIVVDDRKTTWVAAAQRAAAVIALTRSDPLAALLYVLTAGVSAPIVVGTPRRLLTGRRSVLHAGAAACVATPVTRTDVTRLVKLLAARAAGMHVDTALHVVLDPIGRVVRYRDRMVRLSQREFAVLHILSLRDGRPVAADDIIAYVWGDGPKRTRTRQILDVYISALRRRLRRLGLRNAILTVRRFGYALASGPLRNSWS